MEDDSLFHEKAFFACYSASCLGSYTHMTIEQQGNNSTFKIFKYWRDLTAKFLSKSNLLWNRNNSLLY